MTPRVFNILLKDQRLPESGGGRILTHICLTAKSSPCKMVPGSGVADGGGQPPEKMTDVTKGEAARGLEACGPGGQSSPWSALFDLTLSTSHFPYLCNRMTGLHATVLRAAWGRCSSVYVSSARQCV